MTEHRADGDHLREGKADAQPFHLPEWTSEPWQDADGRWWRSRLSGCISWYEAVAESEGLVRLPETIEPPP